MAALWLADVLCFVVQAPHEMDCVYPACDDVSAWRPEEQPTVDPDREVSMAVDYFARTGRELARHGGRVILTKDDYRALDAIRVQQPRPDDAFTLAVHEFLLTGLREPMFSPLSKPQVEVLKAWKKYA